MFSSLVFLIADHGLWSDLILRAIQAIYITAPVSSSPPIGNPVKDFLHPGNRFLVLIEGMLVCIDKIK